MLRLGLRRRLLYRHAPITPEAAFLRPDALRLAQRCQEHLASLELDIAGATVLEVGAGIGLHTSFFLDRGCEVVCTEARPENLALLRARYPELDIRRLDVERPDPSFRDTFDVVYCYGLLYHLSDPATALASLAARCRRLLLIQSCVSFGDHEAVNPCAEDAGDPSQSVRGRGCRPTRPWIFNRLRAHFPFVYVPATQPSFREFPLDWEAVPEGDENHRAIFIGSREMLDDPRLLGYLPARQVRH